MDTETEAEIREALERLMAGRTTFIIAHRIQSVMDADLILVLDKGADRAARHARACGPAEGLYRQIYDLQARIEDELQAELRWRLESEDWRLVGGWQDWRLGW